MNECVYYHILAHSYNPFIVFI